MTLAQKIAQAAEVDLALPMSLTCDAWDIVEQAGYPVADREQFLQALAQAVAEYEADWQHYQFHPGSHIG